MWDQVEAANSIFRSISCASSVPQSVQYLAVHKFPLEYRCQQDLDVKHEAPVLNVVDIMLDARLDRGIAPQAVDLRPARDARADRKSVV